MHYGSSVHNHIANNWERYFGFQYSEGVWERSNLRSESFHSRWESNIVAASRQLTEIWKVDLTHKDSKLEGIVLASRDDLEKRVDLISRTRQELCLSFWLKLLMSPLSERRVRQLPLPPTMTTHRFHRIILSVQVLQFLAVRAMNRTIAILAHFCWRGRFRWKFW